jgi:hypothetical protein
LILFDLKLIAKRLMFGSHGVQDQSPAPAKLGCLATSVRALIGFAIGFLIVYLVAGKRGVIIGIFASIAGLSGLLFLNIFKPRPR